MSGLISFEPPEIRIAIPPANPELKTLLLKVIGGTIYQRTNIEEWVLRGQSARELINKL